MHARVPWNEKQCWHTNFSISLHEKTIIHFSSGKTQFFVKQPQEAHSGIVQL
jgi:hypothetical protein